MSKAASEIREAWPGGPLQLVSTQKAAGSWIKWTTGEYRGPYVCRQCWEVSRSGVYLPEGICGPCRDSRRVKVGIQVARTGIPEERRLQTRYT